MGDELKRGKTLVVIYKTLEQLRNESLTKFRKFRFAEKYDAFVSFVHYAVEAVLDWAIKPYLLLTNCVFRL